MKISVKLLTPLIWLLVFSNQAAYADTEAIKYRQSVYEAIGAQMGAMGSILKGNVPNRDDLPVLAEGISRLSEITPDIFPPGSDEGPTEALKTIWEQPDEFSKAMQDFQIAADNLAREDPAQDMSSFADAFKRLGQTCKACHDRFKAE